jgi:membrane fusion protein, copper/silver efflux system
MNDRKKSDARTAEGSVASNTANSRPGAEATARQQIREPQEVRRWWIKLFVQPALLLVCGAIVIIGLGIAQRLGFISAAGGSGQRHTSAGGQAVQYICPMMCTPPQSEPGRCPVCAMQLVPSTSGGGRTDSRSIQIDPAARRVANIRTVAVASMPMTRTIRAIGELSYDEGMLRTLSAYVDGRLDRLYADYTGVVVKKGDHLALVYSPRLYTGQVELLLAKKATEDNRNVSLSRTNELGRTLYETTRQRLIELGMTAAQIQQVEQSGEANSRTHLCAPISGTVIEKFVVEGQYVKEGQAIYKLADLSTVWLMLKLYPEDAAIMRYGQKVAAAVQSLPGRTFTGRVAFIDPNVDPKTRTVGVRVVIPNESGLLRVGDYAKATIDVPLTASADRQSAIYDPELAGKWISPRHPHVVESSPGKCRICGVDLVPASRFGFTAKASTSDEVLVVPRDAVLMAGSNSVLYVETKPGRFEIRRVVLGPSCGDQIVVLNGVKKGEQVATRGNFLIDSQMQLVGNPSLIDPIKVEPNIAEALPAEVIAALSKLSAEDRGMAESQRVCPVTMMLLGSMGKPEKVDVNGKLIFICCEGCRESLLANPQEFLRKLAADNAPESSHETAPRMDLPPHGVPAVVEPQRDLPPSDVPQAVHDRARDSQQAPDPSTPRAAGQRRETVQ